MEMRYLLSVSFLVLLGAFAAHGVPTEAQKKAVEIYEKALVEQLEKLRKKGKGGEDNGMREALASVEHLKPPDLPVEDLIGLMGRMFQKQSGLNVKVKKPEDFKQEAEKKIEKNGKKNQSKKKDQKDKKGKKKPSMSRSDEL